MAQSIRPYNPAPARIALDQSTASRGNSGMLNELSPPIEQMGDGGVMSKPFVNPQGMENALMQQQNMQQNMQTAQFQRSADAVRGMNLKYTEMSNAQQQAQTAKDRMVAELLVANGGGNASMRLNAEMQDGNLPGMLRQVSTQKAMRLGQSPDLGDYAGQVGQYG